MVEAQLEQDIIKNDNKWAKALKGRIARKVVKQTVMTTVYGVTFIGARDQIEKQLSARGELPEEECWEAASYLAKKVLGLVHVQEVLKPNNTLNRFLDALVTCSAVPRISRRGSILLRVWYPSPSRLSAWSMRLRLNQGRRTALRQAPSHRELAKSR
jgi:hypothetical protein